MYNKGKAPSAATLRAEHRNARRNKTSVSRKMLAVKKVLATGVAVALVLALLGLMEFVCEMARKYTSPAMLIVPIVLLGSAATALVWRCFSE